MEAGNSRSFQRQVEKALATHSSTLAWKTHGRRRLVGCSPWGSEELDTTERLHFHFSLSGIGEGNGNPLQCSCLENPRDGGAWWAAIYGVAQSQTRLKQLSSSSSRDKEGSCSHGPLHPSLSLCVIQDSSRPRLCVMLNRTLHPNVHCSTIHNTQDMETT